jgi:DNA invertase Pin-like site-specific DNA recombinase
MPLEAVFRIGGEASCNPEEGATLTVLEPAFSTEDAAGPILVTVLGMVAEMERKFIRERQQAGTEAAKALHVAQNPCQPDLRRNPPPPMRKANYWAM